MGVSAQNILQSDPEYLRRQIAQQEMQRLNPRGTAAGAIGSVLGRGAGNLASGRGFFDVSDPSLKRVSEVQQIMQGVQFDPENPQQYYKDLASQLSSSGYADLAPLAAAEAAKFAKEEKPIALSAGQQLVTPSGRLIYSAPDREKDLAPTTAAERDYLTSLQSKYPDTTEGRAAAANEFAEWKSSFKQKEAAAGVPGAGEVKVTDLASATTVVDRFVKDPKDRLSTANAARTQLNLAKQGSGPAFAQLQRQLVKLVGDNQISGAEVRAALGRAGIVGDTIDAVNMFMTGTPSRDKLAAVEQVINALEANAATSYNEGRARASTVLRNAKLAPETVSDLIPPPYKTAAEKKRDAAKNKGPAVGTVQQGYRFKGGNPADKNNWEKVK